MDQDGRSRGTTAVVRITRTMPVDARNITISGWNTADAPKPSRTVG
jgi:hypothetical protein